MTNNLAHEVGEVAVRSTADEGAAHRTLLSLAHSTVRYAAPSPSSLRALTSPAKRER